jgi:Ni,Fe-hydrogenase III large subunit/Ni,Fe-hydrogenase III component G
MIAREIFENFKSRFGPSILRADLPGDARIYVYVEPSAIRPVCQHIFRELDARYVISIGTDDRPFSGTFLVAHNFAFDKDHVLCSVLTQLPAEDPKIPSISDIVPAASWAEREMRDLVGIEPVGHQYLKRLVLPDGWPDGVHPLRKDMAWDEVPADFDPDREFSFDEPPEGCTVVPFGPFHPTLDEPAHFRLYVEGEVVRGCEYRGFMVHRGIEKLAESVMSYNDIPMLAERICGICGCVHNVAYAQAVESAVGLKVPLRAEYIRTIMLEVERLHSHLLWVGLACHILGFDTLFMQSFRIREPVMWIAEKISGNRKTYALCLIGGVRWDITPALKTELRGVLDKLETEWRPVVDAVSKDKNIQKRTRGVGVADRSLVKEAGLVGPVARAAGVDIDCRRDHPYAAYPRVEFDVITEQGADVWSRVLVRAREVFE